ncbi:glycosyltransferase [Sodalis ligni]|uniref:Glycosyltransferase involved in cell wall biosynthesis n=1 Tax=Sodalis ligni TaxID=2697027 RepID=A0A4R1NHV4_9GAMM|nr:glycosyltransferase [Sodalis ligni]TCL07335.1 glycosyltransferase involved in cell wall biosynthesis [Sodalis ligni]
MRDIAHNLKVLHTITSMNPELGGVTEFINQIIPYLRINGIDGEVVCMDDPNAKWIRNTQLKIHATGQGRNTYSYSKSFHDWMTLNVKNYDLVIINGIWQFHSIDTKKACIKNKVPYYVFTHGMLDPWFKKTYPLKHIKKLIYWLLFEKNVINNAAGVIYTCEEEKLLASQSFPFYSPREFISSFGTNRGNYDKDTSMALFTKRFPDVLDKKIILFMGRLHEKKGCDLLIKAFSQVQKTLNNDEYILFIAGPDQSEYAKSLKRLTLDLRIDKRVIWGGMLQNEMKWGAFHYADVFCLPSHQENFGIVVAEALSVSTAVIISDKVNIWREIEANNAGLVCKDDVNSITDAISLWMNMPDNEKNEMRASASCCFDNHFDITKTAKDLSNILEKSNSNVL